MAYIDIHNLRYNTETLRKKVSVAITDAAIDVINESEDYPNHTARLKWAKDSLLDTETMTERMMWAVITNAAVQAGGDSTSDTDVQTAVNSFIDLYGTFYDVTVDISEYNKFRQDLISANYKGPKELLIYYGYPNSFNSGKNGWSNEAVAQNMAKYDMIVLGDGVEDPGHADYSNTQIIIPRVKALNPTCKFFGYVSSNQSYANFQTKVDQWNTLEIHGIMMDESGYDFGVTRASFNEKVTYVHGRTYANIVFANAWNIDHVIGTDNDPSYPNTTYNPDLLESTLNEDDWFLLESFAVNTTAYSGNNGFESGSDWYIRGEKAVAKRATYNINLAGCGIINNDNASAQKLYTFGFISSLMWSLGAWGTSDTSYGAGATVNKWLRLETSYFKNIWLKQPSVKVDISDSDVYRRYTEDALFSLDFSAGAQYYTIRNMNVPCNLYSSGSPTTATGSGYQTLRSVTIPESLLANGRLIRVQAGIRRTTGSGNGTYRISFGGTAVVTSSASGNTPIVLNGHVFINSSNVYGYLWHDAGRSYNTGGVIATNKEQQLELLVDLATDSDVFTLDWMTVEVLS